MANIINLPEIIDEKGKLCVIEKILPFEIQRVFYIYNASQKRGAHAHKKTTQALIMLNGKCEIYVNDGKQKETFVLDKNNQCLILEPKDWHTMDISRDGILLVLSSHHYDKEDYIYEEPKEQV